MVDGLLQRGYASAQRDSADARRLNVALTPAGQRYAAAVTSVISSLNAELAARVDESQLAAADVVLRAAIVGEAGQRRAQRLVRPPACGTCRSRIAKPSRCGVNRCRCGQ